MSRLEEVYERRCGELVALGFGRQDAYAIASEEMHRRIARAMAVGATRSDIARFLGCCPTTVKWTGVGGATRCRSFRVRLGEVQMAVVVDDLRQAKGRAKAEMTVNG